jgi:hypothetical protein
MEFTLYTPYKQSITLVSCLPYSSILKMEVTCSSETSDDFQLTARRYIPEDTALHEIGCSCKREVPFAPEYVDGTEK